MTRLALSRALAITTLVAGLASADPLVVYDSIPSPLAGNYPSLGYEATSTSELGDHVVLAPGGRKLASVVVNFSSWACENDYTFSGGVYTPDRDAYGGEACITTPGATFPHPITVNIYSVIDDGGVPGVGPLLASVTQVLDIPYRPSHDAMNCATGSGVAGARSPADDIPFGGTWYSAADDSCYHGYAVSKAVDMSSANLTLPDEVIVGVAYNTSHYGSAPLGGNGPFNSLNVSLPADPPSVGTDVEPETVFFSTTYGPFYCDGGAGGVGVFRRDADCWPGYVPAFKVTVAPINVGIDLRPNNSTNQVNTGAKQLVPIAILGTASFDPVAEVDIETVVVRGASPLPTKTDRNDINRDGFRDLTLYFRARDFDAPTAAECADPAAMLTLDGALTSTGEPITGSDRVTWLGC